MCQAVYNATTDTYIENLGDLRSIAKEILVCHGFEGEVSEWPDLVCLCGIDLPGTLLANGYKVWRNLDVLPEYICEKINRPAALSELGKLNGEE